MRRGSDGFVAQLDALEDDKCLSSSARGCGLQMPAGPTAKDMFFTVAEHALPNLTVMGETAMSGVDFFVQTYTCIERRQHDDTALVTSTGSIHVAP